MRNIFNIVFLSQNIDHAKKVVLQYEASVRIDLPAGGASVHVWAGHSSTVAAVVLHLLSLLYGMSIDVYKTPR